MVQGNTLANTQPAPAREPTPGTNDTMKNLIRSIWPFKTTAPVPTKAERAAYQAKVAAQPPAPATPAPAAPQAATPQTVEVARLKAQIRQLTEERDHWRQLAELTDEAIDARVSRRAQELCASQGIPPLNLAPDQAPTGPDVRQQFAAITDPNERGRFWAAHREELLGTV